VEKLFDQEGFHTTVNTSGGNIADKATDGLHRWLNNFFDKKKR